MAKTKKSPATKKTTAEKATAPEAKKAPKTTVHRHGHGTRFKANQSVHDEYVITKEQFKKFGIDPDTFQRDLYLENNPFARSSLEDIPDWGKEDYAPHPTGDPLIPDDEIPMNPPLF